MPRPIAWIATRSADGTANLAPHSYFTVAASDPPSVAFTTNYTRENRALEIRPTEPLERFRLVKVEILEGVKGPDGGALQPFTLTFTTGGS